MSKIREKLKKLPAKPGVYFFLGIRGKVLYIGKAGLLRDRVRSYFSKDLASTRSGGIVQMVEEASDIRWEETDSVLEALILEAALIKKHQPKYNVRERDDKSFNYVVITKEDFPRVLVVRGRELLGTKDLKLKIAKQYGPFPQGGQLREALGIIRKIFPFCDKCTPNSGKPCFNRQIGLCPGVCTGEISKQEYAGRVQNIRLLFEGKKKRLLSKLKRDMNVAAKLQHFEQAKEIRNAMFALQHIQDIALLKHERGGEGFVPGDRRAPVSSETVDKAQKGSTSSIKRLKNVGKTSGGSTFPIVIHSLFRIEAYDVAHLRGAEAVGVMTVVEAGESQKQEYRQFKIRESKTGGDVPALKEILDRRLGHPEWPLPRLVVVDGGKAQINAATKMLEKYGIQIPVVGVVKDEHHRPKNILGDRNIIRNHERDILLANNEAHRFAIGFHRRRLRKRK